MRWHKSGQSCIRPSIDYLPFVTRPCRSCIVPSALRRERSGPCEKKFDVASRQTPPGAPRVTIWQNSFHYFRPCSNDDKPNLPEQPLDCAGDLRVKPAAILAVLLAAAALA